MCKDLRGPLDVARQWVAGLAPFLARAILASMGNSRTEEESRISNLESRWRRGDINSNLACPDLDFEFFSIDNHHEADRQGLTRVPIHLSDFVVWPALLLQ